jgi:hypothetical protein
LKSLYSISPPKYILTSIFEHYHEQEQFDFFVPGNEGFQIDRPWKDTVDGNISELERENEEEEEEGGKGVNNDTESAGGHDEKESGEGHGRKLNEDRSHHVTRREGECGYSEIPLGVKKHRRLSKKKTHYETESSEESSSESEEEVQPTKRKKVPPKKLRRVSSEGGTNP